MNYFFYGTLMDKDVLEAIIGHQVRPNRLEAAILDDFRRVCARGGATYPVILEAKGKTVNGLLFKNVTGAEAQKIRIFEGAAYKEDSFAVHTKGGTAYAEVFIPKSETQGSSMPWDFDAWKLNYKQAFLNLVKEHA